MGNHSSDGVYSRMGLWDETRLDDDSDPLHPDLRAVLDEFADSPRLIPLAARVVVEMHDYGIDSTSDDGQIRAARVIRLRLSRFELDPEADIERYEVRAAVERSKGTSFVYYVDLYGSAIKIGYSTDVPKRLTGLRRKRVHLLAVEPGGRAVEAQRHVQFTRERHEGTEDFTRSDRLLRHINRMVREHGQPFDALAAAGRAKGA